MVRRYDSIWRESHYRIPVHRRPVGEQALLMIGIFLAFAGLLLFSTRPGSLAEGWYLACWMSSGLLLAGGFALYANRTKAEDGYRSERVILGRALERVAWLGALIAAVVWVL